MDQMRKVERGKASTLHFGTKAPRGPVPISKNRRVGSGPAGKGPARRPSGDAGSGAAAIVVLALVAVGILFLIYWTTLRSISVTVNGAERSTRVGTNLESLLEDNDYFSAKAGRLLSVGGNVIDEAGGDRCAVTLNDKEVPASEFAAVTVGEGATIAVSDGADVTEGYTEETVAMAPGVQMERGGAIQFVSQWARPGKKVVWTGEKSGETVDKEVVEEPVDMIVASRNVHPKGDKKYVALTFDDGPSAYTDDILDILKEKGAKATFYNLGSQEKGYGKSAKRLVKEGHELASHTNAHQYLPNLDSAALRAEITSAADAIEEAAGVAPKMIRAPYGAFTANDWGRAGDLVSCNVLWNIDTEDWKRPGADAIKASVLGGAYNGAIILMHDGGGNREQDVQALPGIIDGLHGAGFEFVTVSELMKLDDGFPEAVTKGETSMPDGAVLPVA